METSQKNIGKSSKVKISFRWDHHHPTHGMRSVLFKFEYISHFGCHREGCWSSGYSVRFKYLDDEDWIRWFEGGNTKFHILELYIDYDCKMHINQVGLFLSFLV